MYGTLRFNSKGEQSTLLIRDRPVAPRACTNCRVKKTKCSGELSGCSRCQTLDIPCVYRAGNKRAQTRKQSNSVTSPSTDQPTSTTTEQPIQEKESQTQEREQESNSTPRGGGINIQVLGTDYNRNESSRPSTQGQRPSIGDEDAIMLDKNNVSRYGRSECHPAESPITVLLDGDAISNMPNMASNAPTPPTMEWSTPLDFGANPLPVLNLDDSSMFPVFYLPSAQSCIDDGPARACRVSTPPSVVEDAFSSQLTDTRMVGLPRLSSQSRGSSSSGSSRTQCQCLKRVVFLIDELETRISDEALVKIDDLDSALATHKEAVKYGEVMAACDSCTLHIENMTLLSFLTERLAALCEQIVSVYLHARSILLAGTQGHGRDQGSSSHTEHASRRRGFGQKVMLFGDYEVDTLAEWDTMVRVLIVMQLRALNALIAATGSFRNGQQRFQVAERKVESMMESMNIRD